MKDQVRMLLEDICLNYSRLYGKKVELVSGMNPAHFGYSNGYKNEWRVSIKVNGIYLFVETYYPRESESYEIVESLLIRRMINNIFAFGLEYAKQIKE